MQQSHSRHTILPDRDFALFIDLVARRATGRGVDDELQELIGHASGSAALSALPASKSIQCDLRSASAELELIFNVGTGKPSGVPRPVVNSNTVAPAATSAVEETPSLPGASSSVSPGAWCAHHSAIPA